MGRIETLWDKADFESIVSIDFGDVKNGLDRTLWREAEAALKLIKLVEDSTADLQLAADTGKLEDPIRVVTILHSSLPHHVGGYTGRAQGLLKGLLNSDVRVVGYTRPGFITEKIDRAAEPPFPSDNVDGIQYHHIATDFPRKRGEFRYMLDAIGKYLEIFDREQPNVVHVRSTYLIALPALIAAHQLNLPVVYEVSGLWELVFEGRGAFGRAKRIAKMEDVTIAHADRVVSMNQSMARLLEKRNEHTVHLGVVPNAVESTKFAKTVPLQEINEFRYDIGYVGSLVDYEGLDTLIEAVHLLKKSGVIVKVKIVGGGAEEKRLHALVEKLSLEGQIFFKGRVAAQEAVRQFEDVNIVVLPRRSTPATECVTPLKPFEAMAAGRPLIVSDVSALLELSQGGKTAKTFEHENSRDLAETINDILLDRSAQELLVEQARQLVRESHNWDHVAQLMKEYLLSVAVPAQKLPKIDSHNCGTVISIFQEQ